jgi:putative colanic acid biosynthesis glycosyltransferase
MMEKKLERPLPNSLLFSIITIVRNDKAGFLETVASIQGQSSQDLEWIIIDGASTDGTQDLLLGLANEHCRFISEKDSGIYDAMNKGVLRAKGAYLIFMNAGDRFADDHVLEKIAEVLHTLGSQPDFLFGDSYEIADAGQCFLKRANKPWMISYGMFTHHQAMLYRRAFAEDMQFETSYRIAGDYDFTARFLRRGASTYHIAIPICEFKRGGLSMVDPRLGREEALLVQKRVLRLGVARRLLNKTAFITSELAKKYGRSFYDRIRFSKT